MEVNNTVAYHTLDVSERPPSSSRSSDLFEDLAFKSECRWAENGLDYYNMANVENFHLLLKKVILGAPKEQKEFYVLDIGAANFQWGSQLADDLDEMTGLPDGIKIHIIGVRGEKNTKEEPIPSVRCEQHRLGAFKVEELMSQFKGAGVQFGKQSRSCRVAVDISPSGRSCRDICANVQFAQAKNRVSLHRWILFRL